MWENQGLTQKRLLQLYREMASDAEAEAQALEWCEGLICDAIEETRGKRIARTLKTGKPRRN